MPFREIFCSNMDYTHESYSVCSVQSNYFHYWGPLGFGGSGENGFFRELGSTGNYFRGDREQALNFGDLGSLAKKLK